MLSVYIASDNIWKRFCHVHGLHSTSERARSPSPLSLSLSLFLSLWSSLFLFPFDTSLVQFASITRYHCETINKPRVIQLLRSPSIFLFTWTYRLSIVYREIDESVFIKGATYINPLSILFRGTSYTRLRPVTASIYVSDNYRFPHWFGMSGEPVGNDRAAYKTS